MTDLRAGATNLFLPTLETEAGPRGKFLEAIRKAAAGEFEILGELGRRPDGGIAYLARDLAQPRLVALRLERQAGGGHNDYVLNVLQELDGSLPASGSGCIRCGKPLRGWGRFCPHCGYDLSGLDTSGIPSSREEVEKLAKDLLGEECRVLGRMRRAEGAGTVVFAKPSSKDTIVGLRLRRGERGEVSMDQATEMHSLSDFTEPTSPPQAGSQPGVSVEPHEAPTLLADAGEAQAAARGAVAPQGRGGVEGARSDAAAPEERGEVTRAGAGKPAPQMSLTVVIFIVAATLTVGIVLGALLSQ
ncbi:MAG: hypothetical protein PVJ76_14445 [Gemmatimonadota bacterium]|jgi:hypothetical protein